MRQLRSGPFADCAPALDAVMARYLRTLGQLANVLETERERVFDEAATAFQDVMQLQEQISDAIRRRVL